jgi:hypothetical protein
MGLLIACFYDQKSADSKILTHTHLHRLVDFSMRLQWVGRKNINKVGSEQALIMMERKSKKKSSNKARNVKNKNENSKSCKKKSWIWFLYRGNTKENTQVRI